jgi:hypothetical protein
MMTIWDSAARQALMDRLRRVTPDTTPRWGKLTARRMLPHMTDAMLTPLGELEVKSKMTPFRFAPLKQLIVYAVPFPKNAPTAPELLRRTADDWDREMRAFESALTRLAAKPQASAWPDHAAFGRLSHRAWGVLMYRHTDHHLTQFGV